MNNLEVYQQEINTIFACLEKLNISWTEQDNINFISNLNEYREDAITFLSLIKDVKPKNEGDSSDR